MMQCTLQRKKMIIMIIMTATGIYISCQFRMRTVMDNEPVEAEGETHVCASGSGALQGETVACVITVREIHHGRYCHCQRHPSPRQRSPAPSPAVTNWTPRPIGFPFFFFFFFTDFFTDFYCIFF